jgi:2-haloacid dehalogenase
MSAAAGNGIRAAVFDAYGTLLDVHAAMQRHADRLPPDWERISAEWRNKQLEYTWVRTLTGPAHHRTFWQVTQDALAFVAAGHGITDPAVLDLLRDAYRRLPAYPDTVPTLRALRAQGIQTAILSNGDPAMTDAAVQAGGLAPLLDAVLSVEDVGVFKPDPRVYPLMTRRFGLEPAQIAFVSSNAWDAQAAAAFGARVFWCNRKAQPDEYGLSAMATVIPGLDALPGLLK